ncbi:bicyclomycin resistance protein [Aspergillus ellipticus CBS 707.79]|uniref:Bicyclomycin resistance protein n=1 Tax=Aspergillus ellipticus CBS 707.79 TaxID=1448320 RepID=A0A319ETJ2_9EURO|nr:bicyclomycin resistance protein [Aspergillus ellipticus CBS 707.79]
MSHSRSSESSIQSSPTDGILDDNAFNTIEVFEKYPMTSISIGGGKPFPPSLPDSDHYVVACEGPDDPDHPYNWSLRTKLCISIMGCFGTFTASFSSGIFAPGSSSAAKTFGVSNEVGILGTTLYVLGFAFGPLIWAPASELIGRRWPLTIGTLGGAIFTVSSAVGKDIQTVIICRFFAGMFGASQLSVVPALLSDIYDNTQRGAAITVYSLAVFCSPFIAPFCGGFIETSPLGWRWTLYIPAIMGFTCSAIFIVFLRETHAPCLLVVKASALRHQTGIWALLAKQEEVEVDLKQLARKYFTRPLRMLVTEPIILIISIYMSFIYGIVYALLVAYPYVFESVYGMSPGEAGLTFIGLVIGQVCACTFIVAGNSAYVRKLIANKNVPVPEWRLSSAIVGAPVFVVGIFWFSWTAFTSSIHWMAPTAAGMLIGFGILCIFLPCFNYLVDAYLPLAASTVAANIMLRSTIAAAFPLVSRQMFHNLGVQWAGTLLGCLATVMIPIPLLFRTYGPRLRARSRLGLWDYVCHYPRPRRARPPASTPDPPAALGDTRDSAARAGNTDAGSFTKSLEANSGAAFVRKIGLKVDPANAPKLNLFGWNIGMRKGPSAATVSAIPIVDILSFSHAKTLADIYFAKVDPCYGFIDASVFFRRMDARWPASSTSYDGVLAGVMALGSLFSERSINITEAHLVELTRSLAETSVGNSIPSIDSVTTWALRVVYMRMTAPPYPTWIASSTLMHLIEASKFHQETPNPSDADTRRRLIGVAQHQNIWISYDLGLSRVSFPQDTVALPSTRPGDFTVELLRLLPLTTSLGPENNRHDQEIEDLLLQTLGCTHTQPPSTLAQCNLVLCLLRRLRMTNLTTSPATMDRIVGLLKRSLAAARRMTTTCSPWQHVANVPFQMISILLEMDTSASLELLPEAMQTLKFVASTYDTETMREAYGTACLLILLYERRRRADTRLLSGLLEDHHQPSGPQSLPAAVPSSEEVNWLEGLVADVPTLQGLDFGQFLQADMARLPENVWDEQI